MGVDVEGGFGVGVAQSFLDVFEVCFCVQQDGAVEVAQFMG